jgi:integrase
MRQRRGFGRVRKRASGRWQAGYIGPDGATHYAPTTYESRLDAEGWLVGESRLIERDEWRPPKVRAAAKHATGLTLRDFAPVWLETHRRNDGEPLKDRTREHYESLLDSRIYPVLGDLPMHLITEDVLTAWRERLPKTPTANAHAYTLLRGILKAAAKKDRRIDPPTIEGASKAKTKHETEPATLDELAVIVENMQPRYRLAILLMTWCALRFGEMAELRRQDVSLRTNKLRIRRGVVRVYGERRVTTPKSGAGARDVTIPPHLVPLVKAHLEEHAQPGPSGLLFPGANGAQVSQSTLNGKPGRRRIIKGRIVNESATGFCKAREAAGRPDLRLHDLRHTGGTLAAQTGATLAELMQRLGHSTPSAAMRYQHAAKDRDKAIAEALSRLAAADQ